MKIFLIRHGQTDWNREGRFQGREDIPLNEQGVLQAIECGNAIKGEDVNIVITSPLIRARRTAEIIADEIDANQIIIEEGITERDFSKVSGMTPQEREVFYASGEEDDKEPWELMCNRMMDSIRKYAKQYDGQNLIMVSHGASINCVLAILSEGSTGTGKIILKNVCINIINYEDDKITLGEYNMSPDEYLIKKKEREKQQI